MGGRFEGRVALITGGNSGIGRVTALAFAREGAKVVIAARRVPEGEETVQMIRGVYGEARFIRTDVTKAAEVEALVAGTVEAYGRLDIAFNNAGIPEPVPAPLAEHTEDQFDRVMSVDLKGVWLCLKYEIPVMLKQGCGVIVNNASVSGLRPTYGGSTYATAKHGVIGMSKGAALEYAKEGIRINVICPGTIRAPALDHVINENPDFEAKLLGRVAAGRIASAEEVAEAVLWLCSDAASYVYGHVMVVDGGLLLM